LSELPKGEIAMSYDDDRRYEQGRLDRIADERRQEQRRQDRLADERRQEQRRADRLADERRRGQQRQDRIEEDRKRDQRRQDYIDEANRHQDREDDAKRQKEKNDLAMSFLKSGNTEAAASIWDLNIGSVGIPSFMGRRISAPTLTAEPGLITGFTRLEWTSCSLGTYVLEKSYDDESFSQPTEVYSGYKREYLVNTLMDFDTPGPLGLLGKFSGFSDSAPFGAPRYYRVKVRNGLTGLESPWSNTVKVEPPKARGLAAPKLEMQPDFLLGTTTWKWTSVTGATGYLLQKGHDVAFSIPVEIYSGENTQYTAKTRGDFNRFDPIGRFGTFSSALGSSLFGSIEFYRVKATGGSTALDSPWSNVV
jgi:hypothetical protein